MKTLGLLALVMASGVHPGEMLLWALGIELVLAAVTAVSWPKLGEFGEVCHA
jgi:hypothetical protein